jgi:ParB-like chromosome segregation protein Spo0J
MHSKKQLRQIGDSIKAFGWTNPIIIDGDRVMIAGHGRLEAAISLGIVQVPTICINDMTEAQKRAYILADNKLARGIVVAGDDCIAIETDEVFVFRAHRSFSFK